MKRALASCRNFLHQLHEDFQQQSPLKKVGIVFGTAAAIVSGIGWGLSRFNLWATTDQPKIISQTGTPTRSDSPSLSAPVSHLAPPAPPTIAAPGLNDRQKTAKFTVWKKLRRQMLDLAAILDRGDAMLDTWLADFQANPDDEIKKTQKFASDASNIRLDLEATHNTMTGDQGEIGALVKITVRSPGATPIPGGIFDQWLRVADRFSAELISSRDYDRQNLEDRITVSVQLLREHIDTLRRWQREISNAAEEQIKLLSN
jgi:hypothetical protein